MGADAGFGDQLHRDQRLGIDLLEIEDQLGEILNGVDVMVRRRRDQCHAGGGVAELGNFRRDLVAGQLAALAGLGALGNLDLDDLGVHQVVGGDAEAAGGHLFDLRVALAVETRGILAALTGIGLAAETVHGHGQGLVGLRAQGADGHCRAVKAREQGACRLDLVEGISSSLALRAKRSRRVAAGRSLTALANAW